MNTIEEQLREKLEEIGFSQTDNLSKDLIKFVVEGAGIEQKKMQEVLKLAVSDEKYKSVVIKGVQKVYDSSNVDKNKEYIRFLRYFRLHDRLFLPCKPTRHRNPGFGFC